MAKYIYHYENWPHFSWKEKELNILLGKVNQLQGVRQGRMEALGFIDKESQFSG